MSEEKLTEIHGCGSVRRVQTRKTIRAPIETVWEALTQIEHVRQWWADGTIGAQVGEAVQLGGDEDLNGSIVAMMKPHVFEFTWHDAPENAAHPEWIEAATRSLVHFDLIETAADTTLLTLINFAPLSSATGASAGWHHLFELLTSYLEEGEAQSGPDRFEALKALYPVETA